VPSLSRVQRLGTLHFSSTLDPPSHLVIRRKGTMPAASAEATQRDTEPLPGDLVSGAPESCSAFPSAVDHHREQLGAELCSQLRSLGCSGGSTRTPAETSDRRRASNRNYRRIKAACPPQFSVRSAPLGWRIPTSRPGSGRSSTFRHTESPRRQARRRPRTRRRSVLRTPPLRGPCPMPSKMYTCPSSSSARASESASIFACGPS
jgi:hypothetical protein